jgi:TolA-binding protein
MADAAIPLPGSKAARALERMKTTAGVLAALAGAITGLWTVYEKVKTDARQYTAASYETLAPQLNQMNEALQKLQDENQQLKKAMVISHHERPRPAGRTKAPAAARPAVAPAPAKPGEAPAAAPTAASAPATPAAPAPAAEIDETTDDPFGKIIGTVNQTREAVKAVRKVPETFQKVLEDRGKK